jgi:hypothetical protein
VDGTVAAPEEQRKAKRAESRQGSLTRFPSCDCVSSRALSTMPFTAAIGTRSVGFIGIWPVARPGPRKHATDELDLVNRSDILAKFAELVDGVAFSMSGPSDARFARKPQNELYWPAEWEIKTS